MFIIGTNPIIWFMFFDNPPPPVYKYNNIEESVDARGVEDIPSSLDLTRNLAMFE